jgi:uncharacterized protein (TIGR00251 family)
MKIPFKRTKNGITVNVKVQPRSSKRGIEVIGDTLRVKLTAPPVDGAANKQLIEILSETLGIGKGSIRIVRGISSRDKVVEIEGCENF